MFGRSSEQINQSVSDSFESLSRRSARAVRGLQTEDRTPDNGVSNEDEVIQMRLSGALHTRIPDPADVARSDRTVCRPDFKSDLKSLQPAGTKTHPQKPQNLSESDYRLPTIVYRFSTSFSAFDFLSQFKVHCPPAGGASSSFEPLGGPFGVNSPTS